MKFPKSKMTYCAKCKKHTEHLILQAKKRTMGTAHVMSRGNRQKNRHRAGTGNSGRYSKPPGGKMYGKKQTKKTDLRFQCKICKKSMTQAYGNRLKKIEFATVE